MKKFISLVIFFAIFAFPIYAFADDTNNEISIGANQEYGKIYGTERNPEQGDTSKWMTIQSGDSGVRIVSKDGKEIIAVDNYGGIYLNGDVYMSNKKIDPNASNRVNGFMYLLIILSLVSNLYLFMKIKKKII